MAGFRKRRIVYLAVIVLLLTVSVSAVASAATGDTNVRTFFVDLRSQLEKGDITLHEARMQVGDSVRQGSLDPAHTKGIWGKFGSKNWSHKGELGSRINALLESGHLTQAQATKIRERIAHGGQKMQKHGPWKHPSLEEIETKLQSAVAEGKITQEQATKIRERIAHGGQKMQKHGPWKYLSLEEIEAKLQSAVAEGKITQEEVDEKLKIFREKAKSIMPDANITANY